MIALEERVLKLIERQEDMLGNAVRGKAVTATLRVSLDGSGADGLSWRTAFQTIGDAVAAASADVNALTLILFAPGTYDIDTTGDPNITKNIVLQGSHRDWVFIVNNHGSATAVIGFSGYVALCDLTIDCGTGTNDGVIIAGAGANGARVDRVYIECDGVTGAQTGLAFGAGVAHVRCRDVRIHGVKANTRGLQLNNCEHSDFAQVYISDCLEALEISNIASDDNHFEHIHFENCTLGLDINGGNGQIFNELSFSGCTRDVDDEVGDHTWLDIHGDHPVYIHPDNFTGDLVNTDGAADTWGADTEIIAAGVVDNPFRVVAIQAEGSANEKFRIRFSADVGVTHYDDVQIEGTIAAVSRESSVFPSQSVPIYNRGTRISCSAKSESGGNNVWVWVEIQEL